MKKEYVPVNGARITKLEAKQIGLAVEQLIKKMGRQPRTDEFASAVRNKNNPAHQIVESKFKQIAGNAWLSAAEYCLRSVDVIIIQENGTRSEPLKAFFLLDLQSNAKKREDDFREIIPVDAAASSELAVSAQEREMQKTLRTAIRDFYSIAGNSRARRVVQQTIEGIFAELEPKPTQYEPETKNSVNVTDNRINA